MMVIETRLHMECDNDDCGAAISTEVGKGTLDLQMTVTQILAAGWAFDPYYLSVNSPLYCPRCTKTQIDTP